MPTAILLFSAVGLKPLILASATMAAFSFKLYFLYLPLVGVEGFEVDSECWGLSEALAVVGREVGVALEM